jgi:hypothetical protein
MVKNQLLVRFYRTSKKAQLNLTPYLEEIIIGSMLGDLSAEKPSLKSNTRLQFKQSLKNKLYIEHLYELFQEYCGTKPLVMSSFDNRPRRSTKLKEYSAIKFQTLSLPCFNKYRDIFYNSKGVKIIPRRSTKFRRIINRKRNGLLDYGRWLQIR